MIIVFILVTRYIPSVIALYILFQLEGSYKLLGLLILQILIFLIFYTKRTDNKNLSDLEEGDGLDVSLQLIPFIDAFILIGASIYLLIN